MKHQHDKTKGAFGQHKPKGEHPYILRRVSCYRCSRNSKFTKKNFPVPVKIDKENIGHLCSVCVRKMFLRKEKLQMKRTKKVKGLEGIS